MLIWIIMYLLAIENIVIHGFKSQLTVSFRLFSMQRRGKRIYRKL